MEKINKAIQHLRIIIVGVFTIIMVPKCSIEKKNNMFNKINYSKSSSLYLILLNYFGISVVEGQEPVVNYIMSIASISLLVILCLINIVIYLIVIYYINKHKDSKIREKYSILN